MTKSFINLGPDLNVSLCNCALLASMLDSSAAILKLILVSDQRKKVCKGNLQKLTQLSPRCHSRQTKNNLFEGNGKIAL